TALVVVVPVIAKEKVVGLLPHSKQKSCYGSHFRRW
ncbi:unnamed protein product, partial [Amoebophrya sp. A120]